MTRKIRSLILLGMVMILITGCSQCGCDPQNGFWVGTPGDAAAAIAADQNARARAADEQNAQQWAALWAATFPGLVLVCFALLALLPLAVYGSLRETQSWSAMKRSLIPATNGMFPVQTIEVAPGVWQTVDLNAAIPLPVVRAFEAGRLTQEQFCGLAERALMTAAIRSVAASGAPDLGEKLAQLVGGMVGVAVETIETSRQLRAGEPTAKPDGRWDA